MRVASGRFHRKLQARSETRKAPRDKSRDEEELTKRLAH